MAEQHGRHEAGCLVLRDRGGIGVYRHHIPVQVGLTAVGRSDAADNTSIFGTGKLDFHRWKPMDAGQVGDIAGIGGGFRHVTSARVKAKLQ